MESEEKRESIRHSTRDNRSSARYRGDTTNLSASSSSESINSWPPDYQLREQVEAHYGVLPPVGLNCTMNYTDDEINLFYSTSGSESSISSYSTVPPDDYSTEKGSSEENEEEDKDEEVAPKKKRNVRVERPVANTFAIEEEVEEEDYGFGEPAGDGNIDYAVDDDGIVYDFEDRRGEKLYERRRRLAKGTVMMRTADWNYTQEFFFDDPNEYLGAKENEYKYKLLQRVRNKEYLSSAEKTLKTFKDRSSTF